MKVLVFDTETTGLPKGKNPSIYKTELWPHIIQLSYIVYCSVSTTFPLIANALNSCIIPMVVPPLN